MKKVDALKKHVQKVEETTLLRDKRLKEIHLNPLHLKINDLIESVANLQGNDMEELDEEEEENPEKKTA